MDRFRRIIDLHKVLTGRRTPISCKDLQDKMDCSRSTVIRAIEDSRDHLGAPIIYQRELNGYLLEQDKQALYELPGL